LLTGLNRLSGQKGVALIAALGIILALTVLTITLAYRAGLFITESRGLYVKNQDLYSAETGLEEARYYLWDKGCVPPNWQCLTITDSYSDVSNAILGLFATKPNISAGGYKITFDNTGRIIFKTLSGSNEIEIDRYEYRIFAKTTNIPKTINILASGERPGQQGTTTVESSLIFSIPCHDDYKQFGQCSSKEGRSGESIPVQGGSIPGVRTTF